MSADTKLVLERARCTVCDHVLTRPITNKKDPHELIKQASLITIFCQTGISQSPLCFIYTDEIPEMFNSDMSKRNQYK